MPDLSNAPSENLSKNRFIRWEELSSKWLHSRKVAILVICFVIADIALFLKLAPFDSWANFMKFVVASYMTANAADGISDAMKSKDSKDSQG
jgi:hypothetical protein